MAMSTFKRFELLLEPEVEGTDGGIKIAPAEGWNESKVYRMKFECAKCRLETKFYSFSMDRVKEAGVESNIHVLHKCRCSNIGMMRILKLLNGRESKGKMMRVMKMECKNILPLKEVLFDFPWVAISEKGNESESFNFSAGVKLRFPGHSSGISINNMKSHIKAEQLNVTASLKRRTEAAK